MGWLNKYNNKIAYTQRVFNRPIDIMQQGGSASWRNQQELMRRDKGVLLKQSLPKFNINDYTKNKYKNTEQEIKVDNTRVNTNFRLNRLSAVARNKTDREIAEDRQAKIDNSNNIRNSNETLGWRKRLAEETKAIGDKFRVSNESNFFDDYVNPAVMIGDMASNLGQAPLQAQQSDSILPYITSVGTPLAVGAMAGIGTQNTGQFVNNLVNPLAGLKTEISPELRKGLQSNGFSDILKNKPNFQSEIDWGKWNKEIPNNKALMQEYNAIEQQAKANGSWMKNPDGSNFNGTPEQFIQQNSENFKKAFRNTKFKDEKDSPIIFHHGHFTDKDFSSFVPSKISGISNSGYEGNYSFFTPNKSLAEDYAGIGMVDDIPGYKSRVKSVYINSENPLLDIRTEFADVNIPKSLREGRDAIVASLNPKEFSEVAIPYGNNVKSATSNNGMFNMSNSNIYKSVLPIGLGIGVGSQIEQKQQGGNINQFNKLSKLAIKDNEGQYNHPGKITEINSGRITMKNVKQPLLAITDNDIQQVMQPEKEYNFKGAKKVIEIPLSKNGICLQKNWLNKYN